VKNPGPDKLRTTILDFAKNPEDNTAHYNEQVKAANADGWTLTARGEKTYGDASKDYRYSRFTKGTSTLLLAAQGNNSTEKNYDIPGEVLLTETDETFSPSTSWLGSLGVPGFEAVYAVAGLVAVAYLVMRRRK
jgi:PGF-CTERM protein